jgi:8-oxo-dGTP diphosphatase
MNSLVSPDFYNPNQDFMGTNGLVLFGDGYDQALSYFRDGRPNSYPYAVDLAGGGCNEGESPFDTFRRETEEEFGITVNKEQIDYAVSGPSLTRQGVLGWFTVARVHESLVSEIVFSDEGLCEQVTSLSELLDHPLLIPRRRQQIQSYLTEPETLLAA